MNNWSRERLLISEQIERAEREAREDKEGISMAGVGVVEDEGQKATRREGRSLIVCKAYHHDILSYCNASEPDVRPRFRVCTCSAGMMRMTRGSPIAGAMRELVDDLAALECQKTK